MSQASPLLTIDQAARYLSIAPRTLRKMRQQRTAGLPVAVRIGGGPIRYRQSSLDSYINRLQQSVEADEARLDAKIRRIQTAGKVRSA